MYAVFDALFSFGLSMLLKLVGRMTIFVCGAIINLSVIILLFSWTPRASEAYIFFIVAALWGISDAVWQTQINGKKFRLNYVKSCVLEKIE